MRQCVLRKHNRYHVAWIPAKFARAGHYVKLLDEDGWLVETVGIYRKEVESCHGYLFGGVSR